MIVDPMLAAVAERFSTPRSDVDPVAWAKKTLDVFLWSKQREILRMLDICPKVAVRSAHDQGKALALDTPIATPTGWTTMGEVVVGNQVFDENGRPTTVTAKSQIWRLPTYAVTFDDGTTEIVNGEHEWNVLDLQQRARGVSDWREHWDVSRTLSTDEIRTLGLRTRFGQNRWRIPNSRPLDLPNADLLVDPYVLGAWLGDGTSIRPEITCAPEDREIIDRCAAAGENVRRRTTAKYAWVLTGPLPDRPLLYHRLRSLGVLGNKHIPMAYLRASREQRLELLRGLMDTDGFNRDTGSVGIDLCDERLAEDTAELVRSLGWKVRVGKGPAVFNGVEVGVRHRLVWRPDICPFYLARKVQAWMPPHVQASRSTVRTLVSIEPVSTVDTVCIEVDSPRHLFLAGRSMVPTHNSFIAAVATARFLSKYPPGTARVVSTAPSVDQVKAVLWNEINQLHERARGEDGSPLLPGRVTQTEWWIGNYQAGVGRKPADYAPGTFQGLHAQHILIIVDEAGAIPNDLWTGIDTLSTNSGAKILAIGNPDDPQSHFKSICDGAPQNGWASIKISAWDSPNFTGETVPQRLREALLAPSWVEDKRIAWGEDDPRWQSKVEAEFPLESGMTIARLADMQIAQRGEDLVQRMWPVAVQLGVDVAGSETGDETVCRERRGNKIARRWSVQSGEPEAISELIQTAVRESGATLVHLDATGVGFGFLADLRKSIPGVQFHGFVAGASAEDTKQFFNRRAEAYWHFRDTLRRRELDLSQMDDPDDKTATELLAVRYKLPKGKVQVEPKDDIRKRLGRSPDDADALLLAVLPPSGTGMPAPATARAPRSLTPRAAVAEEVPVNRVPRAVPEQIIYPGQNVPVRRIRSIRARV